MVLNPHDRDDRFSGRTRANITFADPRRLRMRNPSVVTQDYGAIVYTFTVNLLFRVRRGAHSKHHHTLSNS
jgi:hypothetical protein